MLSRSCLLARPRVIHLARAAPRSLRPAPRPTGFNVSTGSKPDSAYSNTVTRSSKLELELKDLLSQLRHQSIVEGASSAGIFEKLAQKVEKLGLTSDSTCTLGDLTRICECATSVIDHPNANFKAEGVHPESGSASLIDAVYSRWETVNASSVSSGVGLRLSETIDFAGAFTYMAISIDSVVSEPGTVDASRSSSTSNLDSARTTHSAKSHMISSINTKVLAQIQQAVYSSKGVLGSAHQAGVGQTRGAQDRINLISFMRLVRASCLAAELKLLEPRNHLLEQSRSVFSALTDGIVPFTSVPPQYLPHLAVDLEHLLRLAYQIKSAGHPNSYLGLAVTKIASLFSSIDSDLRGAVIHSKSASCQVLKSLKTSELLLRFDLRAEGLSKLDSQNQQFFANIAEAYQYVDPGYAWPSVYSCQLRDILTLEIGFTDLAKRVVGPYLIEVCDPKFKVYFLFARKVLDEPKKSQPTKAESQPTKTESSKQGSSKVWMLDTYHTTMVRHLESLGWKALFLDASLWETLKSKQDKATYIRNSVLTQSIVC